MIRLAPALFLAAGTALAEPVLRIEAAGDRLDFKPGEIAGAEARAEAGAALHVVLTTAGAQKLALFTAGHVGEAATVSACAEVIIRATIVEVIGSGRLAASMPSARDAARTARLLRGEIGCAEHAAERG